MNLLIDTYSATSDKILYNTPVQEYYTSFFNKNIECDEELDRHIVFPLKKKKFIYLDKNILVRENTSCVIVYRYRVCDVLMPGKYKVTSDNLPETFLRAKVNKLNKKGAKLKRIRVDIYYVNL